MPIFGRRHSRKASKDKEKEKDAAHREPPSQSQSQSQQAQTQSHRKEEPPKHQRTKTAPDPPTLLRLPSTTNATAIPAAPRSRRATNPSTPTAATPTATPYSTAQAAAPASYFAPQPAASSTEPRSPPTRRPPASFSAGHDTSRGPPVTLITRGNSDYARRPSQQQQQQQQQPADYAYAQQGALLSPSAGSHASSRRSRDTAEHQSEPARRSQPQPQPPQQQTRPPAQRGPASSTRPAQPMASSREEEEDEDEEESSSSSESESESETESESGPPSNYDARRPAHSGHGATDTSGTEGDQPEDLFLHIAEDSAPKQRQADAAAARHDKLRSRIARVNRMSSPSALQSPSAAPSSSTITTPIASRIPSNVEPRSSVQPRRSSLLSTATRPLQERPPQSPGTPLETPRARQPDLSTKASFSRRDSDLSPRDFLAQLGTKRRGSQPEVLSTPPNRTSTYRPSNLGHYSSSRDEAKAPQPEPVQNETSSRADGTESHGSTGPAVSVWDELDELKTRIRRIEMGGKIPATSGAIISQATAERPRTANTSATTVSSSPKQQRKTNPSPSESTVDTHTNSRTHPLLREALIKARQHTSPAIYRILDATATEALTLAEMTGSAGPQGTLHSASSILGGANVSDRQVRRKADNICRSLTELCIAMCDTKASLASPAHRNLAATISRRPSVQLNGDSSPGVRQSIEPESNTLANVSPSRALHRIEARRTSMLYNGAGTHRDYSQDPADFDRQNPSRLQRAGTSLYRNRQSDDDEEEEPTMRAPSRAMTDFRSVRGTESSRLTGRQYISREPMPDHRQAATLQSTSSLRRPTVTGNENSLLFRDGNRRYDLHRESSPAYEKQVAGSLRARTQLAVNRNPNRNSISGISDLSRNVTLGRRQRGNSTGE
jgi:hypothetical protein